MYFNPRTREGCDKLVIRDISKWLKISIHAPARGATPDDIDPGCFLQISIHAPARGATLSFWGFNY